MATPELGISGALDIHRRWRRAVTGNRAALLTTRIIRAGAVDRQPDDRETGGPRHG